MATTTQVALPEEVIRAAREELRKFKRPEQLLVAISILELILAIAIAALSFGKAIHMFILSCYAAVISLLTLAGHAWCAFALMRGHKAPRTFEEAFERGLEIFQKFYELVKPLERAWLILYPEWRRALIIFIAIAPPIATFLLYKFAGPGAVALPIVVYLGFLFLALGLVAKYGKGFTWLPPVQSLIEAIQLGLATSIVLLAALEGMTSVLAVAALLFILSLVSLVINEAVAGLWIEDIIVPTLAVGKVILGKIGREPQLRIPMPKKIREKARRLAEQIEKGDIVAVETQPKRKLGFFRR